MMCSGAGCRRWRTRKGHHRRECAKIIERNIALAKEKSQPICQDTGSVLFYVDCPVGLPDAFEETARKAVTEATKRGYLRQNCGFVDRQKRRHEPWPRFA